MDAGTPLIDVDAALKEDGDMQQKSPDSSEGSAEERQEQNHFTSQRIFHSKRIRLWHPFLVRILCNGIDRFKVITEVAVAARWKSSISFLSCLTFATVKSLF